MPRIVGLGDPVTDVVYHASRDAIVALLRDAHDAHDADEVEIGGCVPVSARELRALVRAIPERDAVVSPGGSAANVLKGIAQCAADDASSTTSCVFVGTVDGRDDVGAAYGDALRRARVESALMAYEGDDASDAEGENGIIGSARCVCLVDDRGQRTMRTYLGASAKTRADDLPSEALRSADVLHAEGYALYKPDVLARACALAKENGALVSLDLASFEVVRHCRDALRETLESGVVDVIFCNEDEARELVRGIDDDGCARAQESHPQLNGRDVERPSEETELAALAYLLRYVKLAVCSRGKRGCVAMNAEGERSESRAEGVEVIDTTGAGDTFTSGFLHAYLAGGSLRQCGDAGCAAGAEVVQVRGAEMDDDRWRRVREKIAIILGKERSPSATM